MHYARVDEGETFLMGMGSRGGLSYASGLYRATADLDLKRLYDEFMADDRTITERPEPTLLFGSAERYLYHRMEALFQEWLLEQGHVERVPCKLLSLLSQSVRKPDGNGLEGTMFSRLDDPFSEVSDTLTPFPVHLSFP